MNGSPMWMISGCSWIHKSNDLRFLGVDDPPPSTQQHVQIRDLKSTCFCQIIFASLICNVHRLRVYNFFTSYRILAYITLTKFIIMKVLLSLIVSYSLLCSIRGPFKQKRIDEFWLSSHFF
jgi:hypothetical protein